MDVTWLLSSRIIDRNIAEGLPRLDLAVQKAGFNLEIDDVSEGLDFATTQGMRSCVVVHGPKQFNYQYIKSYGRYFIPGSYYNLDNLSYSGFSPYYGKYMLNKEYIILPAGEIIRRRLSGFIRPNSTSKSFTGQVLREEHFDEDISCLTKISGVDMQELCVLSEAKEIESEFRFVIADNEVVTGSEYRWDDIFDIRSDVLPAALELAQTIAKEEWEPDRVYVCDICMSDNKPYLLELNPFSSSGLYACDADKIVEAVSKAAWLEFTGDDI